jgi:hypothetical protein
MQFLVHYTLHLIFPAVIAWLFCREAWLKGYIILLLTMLVDLDHLLARPIFAACRCSINFHPLHSYYAMGLYLILLLPRKTRLVAIGLLFHMLTDAIDCYWSSFNC